MKAITAEAESFSVDGREILQYRAPSSSCPASLFIILVCLPSSLSGAVAWELIRYEIQLPVASICFPLHRFANSLTLPLTTSNINITQLITKSHSGKLCILSGVRFLPRSMRRAWRSCNSHMEFMDCTQSRAFSNLKTHPEGFFIHSSIPSFIQLTFISGFCVCHLVPDCKSSWLRAGWGGGWGSRFKVENDIISEKKSYRNIVLDHNIEAMLNPLRL